MSRHNRRSVVWKGAPIYRAFPEPFDEDACRKRLVQEIASAERRLQRAREDIELFDKREFFYDDRKAKGLPQR